MKRILLAASLATLTLAASAADVGVSINIGQPGFYGQIDIGNYPQPELLYRAPVVIQPVPRGVVRQPIYLHVPPGHAKNWRKYCGRYNACGQPVYFVQDNWYNKVYVPRYRERGRGDGRDDHRGPDHRDDRHDDHGRGHDNRDQGPGRQDR